MDSGLSLCYSSLSTEVFPGFLRSLCLRFLDFACSNGVRRLPGFFSGKRHRSVFHWVSVSFLYLLSVPHLSFLNLLHFTSLIGILSTVLIFLLLKKQFVFAQRFRKLKKELLANWNVSAVIAIEGLFLLCSYFIIDCTAPENFSDSARFYWPYIKLLKHHSGFFDNPYQWSYVIPQAGLAYAGSIYVLLGATVVRWSMFLVWVAIIGILVRGRVNADLGLKISIAMVLGSIPLLLRLSTTLMQDIFVCLVVLVFSVICVENKDYEFS